MKTNLHIFKRVLQFITAAAIALSMAGCGKKNKSALDPQNPVTITIWNYYNGDQLVAFEKLVDEFNGSVGAEKGIVAITVSQGDITTLADSLLDSVNGNAGAQELPTLAAVYSETAYILDKENAIQSFDNYFTEDELSKYIPGFIDEGRFNENNELMLFPIIKSTELFTANETDWQPFADETGITLESLETVEDLTAASEAYYKWTDSLTPNIAEDGKALYGRDSIANYVYLGCYQLGHELFNVKNGKMTLDMDRDTFKTLWDNYYIPYINGYFGAYSKYRSEDCKTGKILALTSSSSSTGYLPTTVTTDDDLSHDISIYFNESVPFKDSVNDAVVQQGANYCLLKSTDAAEQGGVEFLKWFTESQRNLDFALQSGYSPVTVDANNEESIRSAFDGDISDVKNKSVLDALVLSADAFSNKTAYATKPFNGSKDVRALLGDSLQNIAYADREAVVSAIESGKSREEAVAQYSTDEYFDEWFNSICSDVEEAVSQQ